MHEKLLGAIKWFSASVSVLWGSTSLSLVAFNAYLTFFLALTEHAHEKGKVTGREKSEGLLSKIPPANKHYSG